MRTPCELVVKFYLPAIRAQIARKLIKKGLTQIEIAETLGVTQAAVSKYLSQEIDRTSRSINCLEEVKKTAENVSSGIASKTLDTHGALEMICDTCRQLKSAHKLCSYHSELQPGFDKNCLVCSQKS